MDAAGISSLTRLADKAGLSQTTVSRTAHGDHTPGADTITALAATLSVPESTIYKLTHGRDIASRPWSPPAEVQRLSKREQDALTEMIRAMAAGREEQEEVGRHGDAAPNRQAAGSAAPEEYEPTLDRLKYGRSVALKLAKLADDMHQGQADFLWPHLQQVMQQSSDPEDFDQKLEEMIAEYAGDAALRDARQDAAEHYDLAADESIHQGDHGRIGPDDIEHST